MAELITGLTMITILLTISGIGIVWQLFSTKFSFPGFVGIAALLVFFYGHFQAGLVGYGTITLFVLGVVLIFLEFFLPGAISGTLGVASLIASLFLAGEDEVQTGIALLISIFISVVFFYIMKKYFGKKVVLFNRMVLFDRARKEDGYVTNANRTDLLGMEGRTLTMLRPAGTAIFNDERVDVVSEGVFIAKNARVKVIKAEGARIVVRELSK